MPGEQVVNAPAAARPGGYGPAVPLRRPRPDPELLSLFDECGRNVQEASLILRDVLADYPERAGLAGDLLLCERAGARTAHATLPRGAQQAPRRTALDSADVHA